MSSHLGGYLGAPEAVLELWGTLGGLNALLGLFWGILGPSWGSLGSYGAPPGAMLETIDQRRGGPRSASPLLGAMGLIWGVLGSSWGSLGASWRPLTAHPDARGVLLGLFWGVMGPSRGRIGALLELS